MQDNLRRSRGGRIRIGIDIGGTFTDIVVLTPSGRTLRWKASSTPADYAFGILEALQSLATSRGVDLREVEDVIHGTTIATNAILERRGARTGLITTAGFRDVLEFARLRMPDLYDTQWKKPAPLVNRRHRLEVDERVDAHGKIVRPLKTSDVVRAGRRLVREGVTAVAISLLHGYRNPAHERLVARILRHHTPQLQVSLSSDILPEIGEYERTSTTVVNAYVRPSVFTYIESLRRRFNGLGITGHFLIMQSSGGVMLADRAQQYPVHIIESGPAAGVTAAARLARLTGYSNLISFDMGGTTAKASIIEDDELAHAKEYEVGSQISQRSRLMRGGGHVIRVPAIDIAEIGAGGGSIVWFDAAGGIQVGPQSAGAVPGPVCYDVGGTEPTVTDANVVLGYINPRQLAGGNQKVDAAKAEAILKAKVAERLGLSLLDSAYGVHVIANAAMTRALRSVSTERGRDPADFALCAFGGSGPIHAVGLAQAMDIRTVIVPPHPGLFSAFGLLTASMSHHYSQTFRCAVKGASPDRLDAVFGDLERQAISDLRRLGFEPRRFKLLRFADLRCVGQSHALTRPMASRRVDAALVRRTDSGFRADYERVYGYKPQGETIEFMTLRVVAEGARPRAYVAGRRSTRPTPDEETPRSVRTAYFGSALGTIATPVIDRHHLSAYANRGPFIVEEYDSTTVVPPGASARLDRWGNIVVTVQAARKRR
jgi:N-methylhydantoinase A